MQLGPLFLPPAVLDPGCLLSGPGPTSPDFFGPSSSASPLSILAPPHSILGPPLCGPSWRGPSLSGPPPGADPALAPSASPPSFERPAQAERTPLRRSFRLASKLNGNSFPTLLRAQMLRRKRHCSPIATPLAGAPSPSPPVPAGPFPTGGGSPRPSSPPGLSQSQPPMVPRGRDAAQPLMGAEVEQIKRACGIRVETSRDPLLDSAGRVVLACPAPCSRKGV